MKRTVVLAFACLAFSTAPALAARIYNLTPVRVQVQSPGYHITLNPGARSDSLSWKTYEVTVRAGGQYMLIANHGYRVNCSLCDGDGKLMKSATGEFGPYYAQLLGTKRSDKWTCP